MNENTECMSNPQKDECSSKALEENYETMCWGCGLRLLLPSYSPIFKCGWCGAITNNRVKEHTQHWFDRCSASRDRLFVLVVICIIVSIIYFILSSGLMSVSYFCNGNMGCKEFYSSASFKSLNAGGGVWAVYPVLFSRISLSSVFHSICTFILASGTLVNFCLAAFWPAGPPPNILWGNYEIVGKGGLDDYSFCHFCAKPKSAQTHHCRSCKACVLNMDHHCPFIGNCVGATNHHHFVTFLFFAFTSNIYVLLMSIYSGLVVWPTLVYVPLSPAFTFTSPNVVNILKAFTYALSRSSIVLSARAIALVYLVIASLSVAIGLGLLLYQQVQLLYSGQTYIDSLIVRDNGAVGWGNFFRIFGSGHPVFWLLPKKFKSYSLSKTS